MKRTSSSNGTGASPSSLTSTSRVPATTSSRCRMRSQPKRSRNLRWSATSSRCVRNIQRMPPSASSRLDERRGIARRVDQDVAARANDQVAPRAEARLGRPAAVVHAVRRSVPGTPRAPRRRRASSPCRSPRPGRRRAPSPRASRPPRPPADGRRRKRRGPRRTSRARPADRYHSRCRSSRRRTRPGRSTGGVWRARPCLDSRRPREEQGLPVSLERACPRTSGVVCFP